MHPFGALLSRRAVEWTLDIENISVGDQRGNLLALNAADFSLVSADREDGNCAAPTKFVNVVGIAVDDSPSNAGRDCSFGNLRHPRPDWLYQNGSGPVRRILNELDELLGLINGVVVGVDDLNLDAEPCGHLGDCGCLLAW